MEINVILTEKVEKKDRRHVFFLLFLFVALCLVKTIFTLENTYGPISIGDEARYRQFSYEWFAENGQTSVHYPCAYPFAIMIAYFFDDWYDAMLILNVIYSSLLIFPVYLISRIYLNEKRSLYLAVISAFLPYHFIYPRMLMSENIYLPLFFFSLFFALWEPKVKRKNNWLLEILCDVMLGVCVALLCLTRYITIVTLPVYLMALIMKIIGSKNGILKGIIRVIVLIASFISLYLPWFLYCMDRGFSVMESLGFGIASKTNPKQLTGDKLALTGTFYLAYFIILAAPVLFYMIYGIANMNWKKFCCRYNRLIMTCYGIIGALFVAVTRHSWRASYNYPTYFRIMGRYCISLTIMFFILAFVTKARLEKKETFTKRIKKKKSRRILAYLNIIFCVVTIYLSFKLDVDKSYYKLKDGFLSWKAAYDGYRYVIIGDIALVVLLIIPFLTYNLERSKVLRKQSCLILTVMLVIIQVWGTPQYIEKFQRYGESNRCKEITKMCKGLAKNNSTGRNVVLYYDVNDKINTIMENNYIKFFLGTEVRITSHKGNFMKSESKKYVVVDKYSYYKWAEYYENIVCEFDRNGAPNILIAID